MYMYYLSFACVATKETAISDKQAGTLYMHTCNFVTVPFHYYTLLMYIFWTDEHLLETESIIRSSLWIPRKKNVDGS